MHLQFLLQDKRLLGHIISTVFLVCSVSMMVGYVLADIMVGDTVVYAHADEEPVLFDWTTFE